MKECGFYFSVLGSEDAITVCQKGTECISR